MPAFSFVQKGQRLEIPTAEFHNAIIAMLNRDPNFKRGLFDSYISSQRDKTTPRRYVQVVAHNNLDPFSVFTIAKEACLSASGSASCEGLTTGTGGVNDTMGFDYRYAKAYTKQVDTITPNVLLTNGAQTYSRGGIYTPDIVGDEFPILAQYAGELPFPGDEVGVVPDSYTVSKDHTGFIVLSGPNTDDNLIWVSRIPQRFVLIELCLAEDHPGQGVVFDAYKGTWDKYGHGWAYDCEAATVKAIDWRYGVPYPTVGAKGLFTPRDSDLHDIIYECVSLDCEAQDGTCCITGS